MGQRSAGNNSSRKPVKNIYQLSQSKMVSKKFIHTLKNARMQKQQTGPPTGDRPTV